MLSLPSTRALRACAVVGRGEVWAALGACCAPGGRAAVGVRAALGARPEVGHGVEPGGGGSLCPRVGAGREKEEEWIRREN